MSISSTPKIRQHGLTLIELMISITLGIFVLTGLVFLISSSIRTNTQTLRATHLHQEMSSFMQMMTRDLKRAGYRNDAETFAVCSGSVSLSLTGAGPFTVKPTYPSAFPAGCQNLVVNVGDTLMNITKSGNTAIASCGTVTSVTSIQDFSITLSACPGGGTNNFNSTTLPGGSWTIIPAFEALSSTASCVLFSYDADRNGVVSNAERFGFRLNATAGTLEAATASATSCTTGGTWESVTDGSGVEIQNLVVELIPVENTSANIDVTVREVRLTLTGRLRSDTSVTRTIQESVKVRNDMVNA